MLHTNARRAISIAIPLLTAALLWGVIGGIFSIQPNENLFSTGITLSIIFGALNIYLAYCVYRHQVP